MRRIVITLAAALIGLAASAQAPRKGFWMDLALSTGEVMNVEPVYERAYKGHTDYAAEVTLGYRVSDRFAIGAGTIASRMIKSDAWSFPVQLKVRYDILDRLFSPYLAAELGWSFNGGPVMSASNVLKAADEPFWNGETTYIDNPNLIAPFRKGLRAALSAGVAVRAEKGSRVYLGVTAGVCGISHAVSVDMGDGTTASYSEVVTGPGGGTVLVRGSNPKCGRLKPELRFTIGFEL